jgi:prevent-host-death family protein
MQIVPISEAKRRIKKLVDEASQSDKVYYITRYSEAKAVMLGVEHYETLLQRVERLEDGLVQVWAAIEGEGDESVMLPTPDGRWRPFHPNRPVSPAVRAAIEQAARLAWQRRDWASEHTVQEGRQAIERARQAAIAQGSAIDNEREAALDD